MPGSWLGAGEEKTGPAVGRAGRSDPVSLTLYSLLSRQGTSRQADPGSHSGDPNTGAEREIRQRRAPDSGARPVNSPWREATTRQVGVRAGVANTLPPALACQTSFPAQSSRYTPASAL